MEFYLIARSLNGVPVGLHQFIVIFTDSPRSFPAVDYYSVNENSYPIAYPLPWFGKNSNSWTNSILDVVKVANRSSIGDFSGADAVRIHPMYFQGRCKPCTIQNPAYR